MIFRNKFTSWIAGNKTNSQKTNGPVIDTVALCMIRNEQDIIEPFLRHTANLVDLIFVMDNCSTDASRKIIANTARELGNIIVTDLPDEGYNQSEIMTRALKYVQSTVFADFVFLLDADEFLSIGCKQDLQSSLRRLAPMSVGLMPWATYVPDPTLSESDNPDPLDRLTMRRRDEAPQFYKAVLRMAGGFDPLLKVSQGNHHILDGRGKKMPSHVMNDLELLHFPLRSIDQLLAKGVIGWEANLRRKSFRSSPKAGLQWKRLHDIAQRKERPSAEFLHQEAVGYAQDADRIGVASVCAHGIKVKRIYSDGRFALADQLIAQSKGAEASLIPPLTLPAKPKGTNQVTGVTNAFDGDWHWDQLFLDEPPIRFVVERFSPKSVLDLGCGNGLYPSLYQHLGVEDVLGVDGIQHDATILNSESYTEADLQIPFDAGRKFDLVVCLEVVEHIDAQATNVLLDSIARHAKGQILFSMAEPGQPGNGHINCMNISEVLSQWSKRGWQPDLKASLGLRGLSSMSWFRRNIVLLNYTGETSNTPAAQALRLIGDLDYVWYSQSPGQRVFAFADAFPSLSEGYGRVEPFSD